MSSWMRKTKQKTVHLLDISARRGGLGGYAGGRAMARDSLGLRGEEEIEAMGGIGGARVSSSGSRAT